jgi:hypothetical protein
MNGLLRPEYGCPYFHPSIFSIFQNIPTKSDAAILFTPPFNGALMIGDERIKMIQFFLVIPHSKKVLIEESH